MKTNKPVVLAWISMDVRRKIRECWERSDGGRGLRPPLWQMKA